MIRTLAIIVVTCLLNACAGYTIRDSRDRSYDPKNGMTLLDQIPNWDTPTYNKYLGKVKQ